MTRRLQDDSVHLTQWFFDKGAGDGPHRHTENYAQVMQRKLKEAVKKISNLSKEKQQLLEIVNRLRAELGALSKEGKLTGQKEFDSNRRIKHWGGESLLRWREL